MAYRKRSALVAGTIAGVRFAAKSYEPSLMPRSAVDQGLITGGSFLTGFLAGSIPARLLGALPLVGASSGLRIIGLATAGVRSVHLVRSRLELADTPHSETAGWAETGAEVVGALALAGLSDGSRMPAAKFTTLGAIALGSAADIENAWRYRTDEPDATYILTSLGVAAALNAAVAGLVGVVVAATTLPTKATNSRGLGAIANIAGGILTIGGIAIAGKIAGSMVLKRIEAGNAQTEIAYAVPPDGHSVSGSTFSLAGYDSLGIQGRRLVSEVTPPDEISEVMGTTDAREPVRVFVGVESAESTEDQIELAIQELRRAGGFDKSTIVAASPAGTGYVNYIAIEAAELMALGDVATVAIQYGGLPSMLSMNRVEYASSLYASLLTRLRSEIDLLDRDIQLVAYGESLGALTSQQGVKEASTGDDLIVDGALWVGTPFGSALFDELTSDGQVQVYDCFDQYLESDPGDGPAPGVVFVNHDNDPVTKFTPSVAYEMPGWLKPVDRGRGANPNQRWLPGIAFWQGLIDTKNAATVVPGEFYSTGHDYRADLAEFVKLAYGFTDVTEPQMQRIEATLRSSEVRRAEAIDQGRLEQT